MDVSDEGSSVYAKSQKQLESECLPVIP